MTRYLLTALAVALFTATASAESPGRTLENSTGVLDDLAAIPLKGIPPKLLADAEGVVIVPRVVKLGFIFGARGGHGVALVRAKDGTWGEPVFVQFGGASIGLQAGIESVDVMLVFRSRRSLERVLSGKEKLTLGADAAVAAGPVGRDTLAATDAQLKAEVLSYSRSRGLFLGVSLDGSVIGPDSASNAEYQKDMEAAKAAEQLKARLTDMSTTKTSPGAQPTPMPAPMLGPPTYPRRPLRPWRRAY